MTLPRLSPDLRALIFIIGMIFVGAFLLLLLSPPPQKTILSARSDERDGALALRFWLERSGYTVDDSLAIPAELENADLLFVLEPSTAYTPEIATDVHDWVTRGNTLIVAGSPSRVGGLLSAFEVEIDWTFTPPPDETTSDSLPFDSEAEPYPFTISSERGDIVPLISLGERIILASFPEGRGTVWVSGLLYPFTNLGIQDDRHARLISTLMSGVSEGARIAFDEGLYIFGGETQTLEDWFLRTPPGVGVLLIVIITFVFLFIRGRAFGRPLPLTEEKLRREPIEYIRAIARLFRRAGGREDVLRHYRTQFRRKLASRYGVDPALPDPQFVQNLVYRDPGLDEGALRELLARLSKTGITEAALVEAAHDVDTWLRKLT